MIAVQFFRADGLYLSESTRVNNLLAGSTQEIVLDVRGRGFSKDVIDNVVANIQSRCAPVYKDIPVTIMSY